VFLLNSRSALVTAAPLRGHPFSRSYGVNLPSSLTRVISNTLVSSTCLPVSEYGTGSMTICNYLLFRRFSRRSVSLLRFPRRFHSSIPSRYAYGFAYRPEKELHAHNQQLRQKLGPRPSITDHTGAGISTGCPSATTFVLALGPTNLQWTSLPEEPLGFRWTGFSPVFALLMSASALVCSPPLLTLWLRPAYNAPLPLYQ
jgi:hypothetical protein